MRNWSGQDLARPGRDNLNGVEGSEISALSRNARRVLMLFRNSTILFTPHPLKYLSSSLLLIGGPDQPERPSFSLAHPYTQAFEMVGKEAVLL